MFDALRQMLALVNRGTWNWLIEFSKCPTCFYTHCQLFYEIGRVDYVTPEFLLQSNIVVELTCTEFPMNFRRKQICTSFTTSTLLHCLQSYLNLLTLMSLVTTVSWWNMFFMDHSTSSFLPIMYVFQSVAWCSVYGLFKQVHLFIVKLWLCCNVCSMYVP